MGPVLPSELHGWAGIWTSIFLIRVWRECYPLCYPNIKKFNNSDKIILIHYNHLDFLPWARKYFEISATPPALQYIFVYFPDISWTPTPTPFNNLHSLRFFYGSTGGLPSKGKSVYLLSFSKAAVSKTCLSHSLVPRPLLLTMSGSWCLVGEILLFFPCPWKYSCTWEFWGNFGFVLFF